MTRRMVPVALTLVLALLAAPVFAADEEPTASDKAEEFAKAYKKGFKKMASADQIEGVDRLIADFTNEEVTEKGAKKAIRDALVKATVAKDKTVISHAMKKLSAMGEDAVSLVLPTLQRELGKKAPDDTIYGEALETLGKIASENKMVIKQLTKLLKDKENEIVGLSARTMAGYENAAGKVRKELFEELLKSTEGVYSGAQSSNQNLERKWNVIGDDVVEALSKLAHIKLSTPAVARKWFNENKKKSWDPKPKK